jgi:hypothetical protein
MRAITDMFFRRQPHRIDIQHHIAPDFYVKAPGEIGVKAGISARINSIRFILVNAAWTQPYIADRVTISGLESQVRENSVRLIYRYWLRLRELKRLYLDIAASTYINSLWTLMGYARPSQLLLGTSCFWSPESIVSSNLAALSTYDGFDLRTLAAVEHEIALRLFPGFLGSDVTSGRPDAKTTTLGSDSLPI